MIPHLRGRERALEPFGLTGRRAEWIALASLHGGVFTRAQLSDWLGASRFQRPEEVTRRFAGHLGLRSCEAEFGVETTTGSSRLPTRICHRPTGATPTSVSSVTSGKETGQSPRRSSRD